MVANCGRPGTPLATGRKLRSGEAPTGFLVSAGADVVVLDSVLATLELALTALTVALAAGLAASMGAVTFASTA